MEHLIRHLKDNLQIRRRNEMEKIKNLNQENQRDLILISSGKLFELDFLISYLNDVIDYQEKSKKIKS